MDARKGRERDRYSYSLYSFTRLESICVVSIIVVQSLKG